MPAKCVFCDIIKQAAPAYVVFEDDISIGILDRRPLFRKRLPVPVATGGENDQAQKDH